MNIICLKIRQFSVKTASSPTDALRIGPIALANPVLLAPMSGVSDLPFRRLARDAGAGAVVSEMVASRELVSERRDVVRKAARGDLDPFLVQLVGCEAHWMAEGARLAEARGAQVIDINMGCPSREVTGRQSGSALMRDLDHAQSLIAAVIGAVKVPVTLKMRLGWDDASLNAPDLAKRAAQLGVQMLTVHGRTRAQFFKGQANWSKVRPVVDAVAIPVIVNGDITDVATAQAALTQSGAAGVMIGRGAYGAPWQPGRIAKALQSGRDPGAPALADQAQTARAHIEAMLVHYGTALGLKNARKHIGWYLETTGADTETIKAWRRRLCTDDDAARAFDGLDAFYRERADMIAGEHAA
jgi:tRNA-dihydrouridine synthase B